MGASIAVRIAKSSQHVKLATFLEQDWKRSIVCAARRQKKTPPGAPLWHFLTRPALIAYTDAGELALALGDPPLVLLSSDAALLPELYLELEVLRYYSQLRRMNERQRQHQARIYTAGAYLADALEQLAAGLLPVGSKPVPAVSCGQVSIDSCPRRLPSSYVRPFISTIVRDACSPPRAWRAR